MLQAIPGAMLATVKKMAKYRTPGLKNEQEDQRTVEGRFEAEERWTHLEMGTVRRMM